MGRHLRIAALLLALALVASAGVRLSEATLTDITTNAGNAFAAALDWTAPTVTTTDPGPNLRGTVTLEAVATDADTGVASVLIQRRPAGSTGPWTDVCTDPSAAAGNVYSCSLNTVGPPVVADGLYDLRAIATDVAGNNATSATVANRRVDNTPPAVTTTDPGPNLRGTVTLEAVATDSGSGVASVLIQRRAAGSTGAWTDVCTDTSAAAGNVYSCSLNTVGPPVVADGLYDLRAIATDAAGNPTTSATVVNRRVDNTAPAGTVTDPGQYLRGNAVTVNVTASDTGGSGVASVRIQRAPANGTTWTDLCTDTTPTPYSCPLDTTALADGLYDFRAVITDAAGNTFTTTTLEDRRVDNTPPTVTVDDPGQYLRGTVTFGATSADDVAGVPGSGVASVVVQYSVANANNWTTLCTANAAPWDCPPTNTAGINATYDFRAIATDNAGNQTTSAILEDRIIDNTGPTATGIASTNGGTAANAGVIQTNDTLTYTFSERMRPESILTGWDGSSTAVRFRLTNNANADTIAIQTTGGGTINLGSVNTNRNFVGANTNLNAQMELRNNGTEVRITLSSNLNNAQVTAANMAWTPSTAATDMAGNPMSNANRTETDNDRDF